MARLDVLPNPEFLTKEEKERLADSGEMLNVHTIRFIPDGRYGASWQIGFTSKTYTSGKWFSLTSSPYRDAAMKHAQEQLAELEEESDTLDCYLEQVVSSSGRLVYTLA